MALHERSSADHATAGLSGHVVGRLGTGEQLVLWALRQRLRDGEPASPVLVRGFRLAFGLAGLEPALAAFEDLFRALDERTAGPGCRSVRPLPARLIADHGAGTALPDLAARLAAGSSPEDASSWRPTAGVRLDPGRGGGPDTERAPGKPAPASRAPSRAVPHPRERFWRPPAPGR